MGRTRRTCHAWETTKEAPRGRAREGRRAENRTPKLRLQQRPWSCVGRGHRSSERSGHRHTTSIWPRLNRPRACLRQSVPARHPKSGPRAWEIDSLAAAAAWAVGTAHPEGPQEGAETRTLSTTAPVGSVLHDFSPSHWTTEDTYLRLVKWVESNHVPEGEHRVLFADCAAVHIAESTRQNINDEHLLPPAARPRKLSSGAPKKQRKHTHSSSSRRRSSSNETRPIFSRREFIKCPPKIMSGFLEEIN